MPPPVSSIWWNWPDAPLRISKRSPDFAVTSSKRIGAGDADGSAAPAHNNSPAIRRGGKSPKYAKPRLPARFRNRSRLKIEPCHNLPRSRRGQRGTHAIRRNPRIVQVAEAAGQQSLIRSRRRILRTARAGIRQRQQLVEQVEELR